MKASLIFGPAGAGEWRGPIKVSFNPDTLSIQVGSEKREGGSAVDERQGVNQKAAQEPVIQVGGVSVTTVSMQLKFDMVDLYRRTVDGRKQQDRLDKVDAVISAFDADDLMASAIQGVAILATPTDYTQISLLNPQYSCYSLLEEAASHNLPVGFLWGPMRYIGVLTSFSSQFVYFSDQGAPLRADVSLSIRCAQGGAKGNAAMKGAEAQQEAEAKRTPPGGS